MSKDTYDFSDLEAILAEFRDEGSSDEAYEPEPAIEVEAPPAPPLPEAVSPVVEPPAEEEAPPREATVRFELAPERPKKKRPVSLKKEPIASDAEEAEKPAKRPRREKKQKEKPEKSTPEKPAEQASIPAEPVYVKRRVPGVLRFLLSILFFVFTLGILGWVILYLHPASDMLSATGSDTRLRLSEKLDVYVNNATSDALGELTYIRKIYTLQEGDTVAPAPDPSGFGTTYDPADIEDLLQRAAVLLDGQKVTFDPTADFVPDEPIRYYLDDTILVIAWKEYIEQRCCTFAEVKIAHGSQLKRKLAEDTYGTSIQLYASDMANASNAVVAMNGDFYSFQTGRGVGTIHVYQRKIYSGKPTQLDTCFFTSSGDMLFARAGELNSEEEIQRYIDENDAVFSLCFGPVLVDNGELQYCATYPIGEIGEEYSRSCIAMTDELHYLLMTINHTPDARPRASVNELARIIYSKNVWKAFNLDGGQTAEIIMMGGPINHVDYGYERAVSDIIYFATAIPEEVRS